ncbi:MAG: hypothetical protein M0R30_06285 [Methanoregula sp.]|jgi:hypothetical protein|uniref:UPF0146 family protein n=1 Tax=Methanoregula sp. TaxID=2052170 RepID=UPI0025E96DB7|nr:UPF0146 family protein [Methanoregula sp.]MCK9631235.1 hypothetical protein [Methanoregula sp.]
MDSYKHIENCVGRYIAGHYASPVEVGIGKNFDAAEVIHAAGIPVRCTDVKDLVLPAGIAFRIDDVFEPDFSFYRGADVIYAIRPAVEMVPPLIALAEQVGCDLLVYHMGFEVYGNGGEPIDCGVLLHRYVRGSKPVKQG